MNETSDTISAINISAEKMIKNMGHELISIADTYGTGSQEWQNNIKFCSRILGQEAYSEFIKYMKDLMGDDYKPENATLMERKAQMNARVSELRQNIHSVLYDMQDLDRYLSLEHNRRLVELCNEKDAETREVMITDVEVAAADRAKYLKQASILRACKDSL